MFGPLPGGLAAERGVVGGALLAPPRSWWEARWVAMEGNLAAGDAPLRVPEGGGLRGDPGLGDGGADHPPQHRCWWCWGISWGCPWERSSWGPPSRAAPGGALRPVRGGGCPGEPAWVPAAPATIRTETGPELFGKVAEGVCPPPGVILLVLGIFRRCGHSHRSGKPLGSVGAMVLAALRGRLTRCGAGGVPGPRRFSPLVIFLPIGSTLFAPGLPGAEWGPVLEHLLTNPPGGHRGSDRGQPGDLLPGASSWTFSRSPSSLVPAAGAGGGAPGGSTWSGSG